MSYRNPDAEAALEHETIALFHTLGWATADCTYGQFGAHNIYDHMTAQFATTLHEATK